MLRWMRWLAVLALAGWVVIGGGMAATAQETAEPRAIIFLDPGHGGSDSGAVFRGDGFTVVEADVNLRVGLLTAEALRARGYAVHMSRETADQPGGSEDVNGDGRNTNRDGLQAVIDKANAAGADLFLSIHHNGSRDARSAGSEAYYCADRPFADESFRFGELVLSHVRAALRVHGYSSPNRGVKDDSVLYTRGSYRGHLYVLGPVRAPRLSLGSLLLPGRRPTKTRATEMPGVLSEALFVSNASEASLLAQPRVRAALAEAFADAVDAYFAPPE